MRVNPAASTPGHRSCGDRDGATPRSGVLEVFEQERGAALPIPDGQPGAGRALSAAGPGAPTEPLRAGQVAAAVAVAALPLGLAALASGEVFSRPLMVALHGALILFLVVIAGAAFAVQWYAAEAGLHEARGRFVGAAFLGLAVLEGYHLLAVPGMPGVAANATWDHGAAWWHGARGWMAVTLIAAAFVPRDSDHPLLRRGPIAAISLLAAGALFAVESAAVGPGTLFPPGGGTTLARAGSEVVLALLCVAGLLLHLRRYRASGEAMYLRVATALGLSAVGQVAYGLSHSGIDLLGITAHVYSAVAGWVVFDTFFVATVLDPYRRLAGTTRELAASNRYLEQLRGRIEGELAETIGRLAESTERETKARAELEAAIAAAPEAILVISPDGRVVRQNAMAERLFAEALDLHDDSVMSRWRLLKPRTTDGRPIALEDVPLERALRGETVRGFVMAIQPREKRGTWVSVSAAPIRAENRIVGAVAAVADVSALQELQGRQEDLLRAVSHDLRNPLQIVLIQAERLLRLVEGADKPRRAAEAVVAASRQMGGMIRDLVDVARMESGRLKLSCRSLDLRAWLPELVAMSAGVVDPARVRLSLPGDLPLAWADPERLDRVVLNLLTNAFAHSPAGAAVEIHAAAGEEELRVSVRDQGTGIPGSDLPHVFERFYRGPAGSGADGLGLGLFISRLLVEAHGGHIAVESPPGQGATFTFTVPLAVPMPTRGTRA